MMQEKSHQNLLINHKTNSLSLFLSRLNYNRFFNFSYNFLAFISVFYVIFVLINHEITQAIVILDLMFLFLFSFELIVRYFSVRNLKKFWKIYYLDIIALIGWIPLCNNGFTNNFFFIDIKFFVKTRFDRIFVLEFIRNICRRNTRRVAK